MKFIVLNYIQFKPLSLCQQNNSYTAKLLKNTSL
jgi:hypothetical protein